MIFIYIVILIGIIIVWKVYLKLTLRTCKCKTYLHGKTAIITGGNSGLGYQTALTLASRGCRVIIADKNDSTESRNEIIKKTQNPNIISKHLDLASLASVRQFASTINATENRLDILINNAGISAVGDRLSADGLNLEMQVNHFGPFLLTHLLIDLLKKSAPSRIIFVSSVMAFAHNLQVDNLNKSQIVLSWGEIPGRQIYNNSKLAGVITAKILTENLQQFGITANCLHPGAVQTNLFFHKDIVYRSHKLFSFILYHGLVKYFGKTAEEGAQTTIHLALCQELEQTSGKFFMNCRQTCAPSRIKDDDFCRDIYQASADYVKMTNEEKLI